ncbi:hypothetical protein PIB30_100477, partial [Stylosanthes scabra]|nr:hypothetical protein [Stylosanthes scabra]
ETRTNLLILEEFEDKTGDNMAGNEVKVGSARKLKKGSLQIKKRNLEAKQSRVPRICVEEHAYACCSYPNPRLRKLTTLRRGNSLDQIHAYA